MKNVDTFKILRLIGEIPRELLSPTETHLLNKITVCANKQGKGARPGIQKLIRETKCSDRTVRRALNSLVSKGFLIIAFKPKNGSWRPVCYDINVQLLEEKAIVYKDDYLEYGEDLEENTVYVSGVTMTETPVTVSQSPVIKDINPGHSAAISTYDLPISTIELPNNNVELASNSTTVVEEPPLILEAEPTKSVSKPEPEEQPEPLATISASQPKAKSNPNHWAPLVASIFAYWQTMLKHPRAKLDANRRRCITNALRLGFSEDELKKAIDGISKSPYHMGDNERKIVYDDLDLIFRNAKYIEKFMGFDDKPPAVPVAKPTHNGKSFWQQDADLSRRLYELDLQDWKKWQEMAKSHPACKQEIVINSTLELQ